MEKQGLGFKFIGALVMLILMFLLITISYNSSAIAEENILVGCTLPLERALGIETKKTFEVIVDDFNKSGGLTLKGKKYYIKLIIYDDKYTPEGGRASVERLVNSDKVKVLINQLGSPPTVAALSVTEPEKITVWAGPASNKFLEGKKYTYRIHHYLLKDVAALNYLKNTHPNIKTVATLGRDDLTGRAMTKSANESSEIIGFKVIGNIHHPAEESDFSSVATKIKSLNPDLLVHAGNVPGTQYGLIRKALHQVGFKGVQYGSLAPKMDECLAASSLEAMEGLYCEFPDPTEVQKPTPEALKVRKLYESKYGKWDETGSKWVSCWYAWLESVKKANSLDPDDIQKAADGLKVSCPVGILKIIKRPDIGVDRYADAVHDWNAGQVRSGKVTFIKQIPYSVFIEYAEKKYGKKFE